MTDNSNNNHGRVLTTRNLSAAMEIIKQKAIEQGIITEEQLAEQAAKDKKK